jgi:hypothetical protein
MALNHELLSLGGRLIEATSTAPDYKLYALKGTVPPKPGMLRVAPGAALPLLSKSGRSRQKRSARSLRRSPRRCRSEQ